MPAQSRRSARSHVRVDQLAAACPAIRDAIGGWTLPASDPASLDAIVHVVALARVACATHGRVSDSDVHAALRAPIGMLAPREIDRTALIRDLLATADDVIGVLDVDDAHRSEDPVGDVQRLMSGFIAAVAPDSSREHHLYVTPPPLARSIVRGVDRLLIDHLGRPAGLASVFDGPTRILDPAAGPGIFLLEILSLLHDRMGDRWPALAGTLRGRLVGHEVFPTTAALAQLGIGLHLMDLGCAPPDVDDAMIMIRDGLAPPGTEIFDTVIGNPPFAGFSRQDAAWITSLLDRYRTVDGAHLGEKRVWLRNDYVKFMRLAQWHAESSPEGGIVGLVTDHSYLDSPTFRGLRASLLQTFDVVHILDLHGNVRRRERRGDSGDAGLFDISQGVAATLLARGRERGGATDVRTGDLYGSRDNKLHRLTTQSVVELAAARRTPVAPSYTFAGPTGGWDAPGCWVPIDEVFEVGSNGIQTSRDALAIAATRGEAIDRLRLLIDDHVTDDVIRNRFACRDSSFWTLADARETLRRDRDVIDGPETVIRPITYRPFDTRWLIDHPAIVHRRRQRVMDHLARPGNTMLSVGRAGLVTTSDWSLIFATSNRCDHNLFYRGSSLNYPLWRRDGAPNIRDVDRWRTAVDPCANDDDWVRTFAAAIYAMLWSPSYRTMFAGALRIGPPRIPMTTTDVIHDLAVHGGELLRLHTTPESLGGQPRFIGERPCPIDRQFPVELDDRIMLSPTAGWVDLDTEVLSMEVGGYPIIRKRVRDLRDGDSQLSPAAIAEIGRVIGILGRTRRLQAAIDDRISRAGGWTSIANDVPVIGDRPDVRPPR